MIDNPEGLPGSCDASASYSKYLANFSVHVSMTTFWSRKQGRSESYSTVSIITR